MKILSLGWPRPFSTNSRDILVTFDKQFMYTEFYTVYVIFKMMVYLPIKLLFSHFKILQSINNSPSVSITSLFRRTKKLGTEADQGLSQCIIHGATLYHPRVNLGNNGTWQMGENALKLGNSFIRAANALSLVTTIMWTHWLSVNFIYVEDRHWLELSFKSLHSKYVT